MRRPGALTAIVAGVLVVALVAACGTDDGPPTAAGPDPGRVGPQGRVAQFVVECELSHMAFDDPIVLPWQPGQSHQHMFFGNRDVTSDPTYGDLLGADTTCAQRRDTASYWAPALLDRSGRLIEPTGLSAYYRPGRGIAPAEIVAYPEGLMLIGGDSTADDTQRTDVVAWSCGTGAARDATPQQCGAGTSLRLLVTFPDCWDGERLTGFGSSRHARYSDGGCPESHPVALPQLTLGIDFPPVDPRGLSLSSGDIRTAHADFWNVWDQDKLVEEVTMCLNRDLVCGLAG
ncbi:MAG: DUF1996 domain-containing protein, partial [Ilumatobacter sp.]|nr:DUF1996 domain-containing protein [Ilumatobacter sp.]